MAQMWCLALGGVVFLLWWWASRQDPPHEDHDVHYWWWHDDNEVWEYQYTLHGVQFYKIWIREPPSTTVDGNGTDLSIHDDDAWKVVAWSSWQSRYATFA